MTQNRIPIPSHAHTYLQLMHPGKRRAHCVLEVVISCASAARSVMSIVEELSACSATIQSAFSYCLPKAYGRYLWTLLGGSIFWASGDQVESA